MQLPVQPLIWKSDFINYSETILLRTWCFLCSAENILVRPVYDDGSDERLRGKTATECLKIHCDDLSKRIHGEDSVTCANNAGYGLFILYTGHGHGRDDESKGADDKNGEATGGDDSSDDEDDYNEDVFGDWCPTEKEVISKEVIDEHLESLFKCSRSRRGQVGECKTGCM